MSRKDTKSKSRPAPRKEKKKKSPTVKRVKPKEKVAVSAGKAPKESPAERKTVARPPPPVPQVVVRHGGSAKTRSGKGFSVAEISKAGLAVTQARKWSIPVDTRRRSLVVYNSESLAAWLEGSAGASHARKPKPAKKR